MTQDEKEAAFIEFVEKLVDSGYTTTFSDEDEWNCMLGFFVGKGMTVEEAVGFVVEIEAYEYDGEPITVVKVEADDSVES